MSCHSNQYSISIKKISQYIKLHALHEQILLDSTNHLLEALNDKDEKVRVTIHSSLIRIAEKRPDDIINILCDYRTKNPKLGEVQVATILR